MKKVSRILTLILLFAVAARPGDAHNLSFEIDSLAQTIAGDKKVPGGRGLVEKANVLNQNILFKTDLLKTAFVKYSLNNGEEFGYGYGWHIKEMNSMQIREHGGSIFGFKSMGIYIPGEDIYVVALSNCSCNSPTQIARDIAALALKEFSKK